LMMAGPYPDLLPALPTSFVNPSRTSKVLGPGIVLATVSMLGVASLFGLAVAGKVLAADSPRTKGIVAVQFLAQT